MIDLSLAQKMNQSAFINIGWWEVGQFDNVTLDYFMALSNTLPTMRAGINKIEHAKQKYREEFKRANAGRRH